MDVTIILALLGVSAEIGLMVGCFQWGAWKAKAAVERIGAAKRQKALDAMARPVPHGSDVLDQLSNPSDS